jgi:hypothetical protein
MDTTGEKNTRNTKDDMEKTVENELKRLENDIR